MLTVTCEPPSRIQPKRLKMRRCRPISRSHDECCEFDRSGASVNDSNVDAKPKLALRT